MKKPIRLIPYSCGAGAYQTGAEKGPAAFYQSGLEPYLRGRGLDAGWVRMPSAYVDYRNLAACGTPERTATVLEQLIRLQRDVKEAAGAGSVSVTLGGDHSMALGSLSGLAQARAAHGKIGLLWIDAHPDIHTWETSRRKTFNAIQMTALTGQVPDSLKNLLGPQAVLSPAHIFYVGLRSIDEPEIHALSRLGIRCYTNGDLDQFPLARAFEDALSVITKGTSALALSFDLDACDPSFAPGVGYPVPGGIMRRDLLEGFAYLKSRVAFDLVEVTEYYPDKDRGEETADLAKEALGALLA